MAPKPQFPGQASSTILRRHASPAWPFQFNAGIFISIGVMGRRVQVRLSQPRGSANFLPPSSHLNALFVRKSLPSGRAFIRINRDQPGISASSSKAWEIATEFVRPKDLNHEAPKAYNMDTVRAAYEVINQSRRLLVLLETFLDRVHNNFYPVAEEVEKFIGEYEVPHI
uniref:Uncharacterized protein n=2 Tax=Moniliophthora roreri TaxID=221103 RepID=A0A0W0F265_MONRR